MIRHVATFTFNESATEAQKSALDAALQALPDTVESIRSYTCRPNIGSPNNHDYIVIGDFSDMDGYHAYANHPDHVAVIETYVKPILDAVARIQIEV